MWSVLSCYSVINIRKNAISKQIMNIVLAEWVVQGTGCRNLSLLFFIVVSVPSVHTNIEVWLSIAPSEWQAAKCEWDAFFPFCLVSDILLHSVQFKFSSLMELVGRLKISHEESDCWSTHLRWSGGWLDWKRPVWLTYWERENHSFFCCICVHWSQTLFCYVKIFSHVFQLSYRKWIRQVSIYRE